MNGIKTRVETAGRKSGLLRKEGPSTKPFAIADAICILHKELVPCGIAAAAAAHRHV
jgi:hypothetical protein